MSENQQNHKLSASGFGEMLEPLVRAVEQSADLVIITDRHGVIEYVNPAFENLTGYTKQEVVGRHSRLLKSGEHSATFYEDLWQTILAGEVYRGALADRKKNGEIFFLEKTITPVRDANQNIIRFISNDRDVTDRKKLEGQLQQMQRMDALGAFAGGIAHDFNNLLMVMSAYAELTMEALAAHDPLRHNVAEILQASRRASDLTRKLLAFSRKPAHTMQSFDLNSVLRDLSDMLPRLVGENIRLKITLGHDLKVAKADPAEIEQLVLNLASNARDAMPTGGDLEIETAMVHLDDGYVQRHAVATPGDYVLLTVTDSGEGIAPEHMAHIFEPFYTTKPKGRGTGLGLATAYATVKQSGGHIWVYSEKGLGTTFKVYLPCPVKHTERTGLSNDETCPRGAETILLVEDDIAVRHSERDFLISSGYRVLEADNAETALQVAGGYSGAIHLVITDIILPQMDGAQLAQRISRLRAGVKVLFVSGYAASVLSQHGHANLEPNFLEKPFTRKALAEKTRAVLNASAKTMSAGA